METNGLVDGLTNCYKSNGIPQETCCPISYSKCDKDTGQCGLWAMHCGDIFDETECNEASLAIAENDLDTSKILGELGLSCNVDGNPYGSNTTSLTFKPPSSKSSTVNLGSKPNCLTKPAYAFSKKRLSE